MTEQRPVSASYPVRVPLTTVPLGIFGSLKAGRRNVLELIPEIATRQPMLSGKTGKRWHMVMDPGALKRVLRDKVEDYPKSLVTKLILEPAIGDSWPCGCSLKPLTLSLPAFRTYTRVR